MRYISNSKNESSFYLFQRKPLKDNNKFTLDFSDEEFVQEINFNKKKKIIILEV